MNWRTIRFASVAALLVPPAMMPAQQAGAPRAGFIVAPTYQSWSFADAVDQDSLRVTRVSQLAIPVAVSIALGSNWNADLVGAFVNGAVEREGGGELTLSGLTDVRLRLVGRLPGDRIMLTAGVNLPTGKSRLAGEELSVLRLVGAPALRLPAPALGTGFGATLGFVAAQRMGGWAVALGTSYEHRGSYQPIESVIAGVTSATDLDPGDAIHLSLGADRVVGQHRLALVLAGDLYGEDEIALGSGSARQTSSYKLGPTLRGLVQLDLGLRGFREFSMYGQVRHRSPFTGIDGDEVDGSSGTVFEAGVGGVRGRPGALGIRFGFDAMIDSGLEVDNSLATAGSTIFGGTLGLSVPAGRTAIEPFVRLQLGEIDTGPQTTSATGLSLGLSIGAR